MIDELKIRLGNKEEVKKWVNERSEQGYTAIHYASYRGNIEIIEKLIENGAEIEVVNKRGLNVMHMASQGNQPASLVYFKEKFDLNFQTPDDLGSTPLHWASYTGSEIAVIFLLSWEPNINAKDREGLTPLHLSVMSGILLRFKLERTRIIKRLLQQGADKTIKDHKGRTPHELASSKGKMAIVEMLKINSKCNICAIKLPLQKMEKNNINVIFFFFLHAVIETLGFFFILPRIF
jgi:ankyrin repeat protein